MFKLFFIYLLLAHILGDYYFQTKKLAEDKNESLRKQLIHGLIYAVIGIVSIVPIFNNHILIAVISLSISHLLIDLLKYYYVQINYMGDCPSENQRMIYLVDQFLHISCIFIAAYVLTFNNIGLSIAPGVLDFLTMVQISPEVLLSWITVVLLIWKPTNITIKQLLCLYKPSEESETDEETEKETGAFIGLLERLIILIFISISQYSAIGLVLTAKSIARYNKITENKEFAEYYLLGTLLSTFIVIGAYLLIL